MDTPVESQPWPPPMSGDPSEDARRILTDAAEALKQWTPGSPEERDAKGRVLLDLGALLGLVLRATRPTPAPGR